MSKFLCKSLLVIGIFCVGAFAHAKERIVDFDVQMDIDAYGSARITETIKVHSQGQKIRRGIYRVFNTTVKTKDGSTLYHPLMIRSVQRDQKKEKYRLESMHGQQTFYIGDPNVFLDPGIYTYTIEYEMKNLVRFYSSFDELIWNVTGDYWEFPIEKVTATIHIDPSINPDHLQFKVFEGNFYDIQDMQGVSVSNQNNQFSFQVQQALVPKEGVTFYIEAPKGQFINQSLFSKIMLFPEAKSALYTLAGFFLLYLITWVLVGIDPRKKTIIPHYTLPKEFTPGLVAKIKALNSSASNRLHFTAMIIHWFLHQWITIEEKTNATEKEKNYSLKVNPKIDAKKQMDETEQSVFDLLFAYGEVVIDSTYNRIVAKSSTLYDENLKQKTKHKYFRSNAKYVFAGFVLSVIAVYVYFKIFLLSSGVMSIPVFVYAFMYAIFHIFYVFISLIRPWYKMIIPLVVISIFCFIFMVIASFSQVDLFGIPFMIGMWFLNMLFINLVRSPTKKGREVLDLFEGYKMFLSAIDQSSEFKERSLSQRAELFEKHYGYAFVFGLDKKWGELFHDVIENALTIPHTHGSRHALFDSKLDFGKKLHTTLGKASTVPRSSSSSGSSFSSSSSSSRSSSSGGSGGGGGGGW